MDLVIQQLINRKEYKKIIKYIVDNSMDLDKKDLSFAFDCILKNMDIINQCKFAFNVGEPYISKLISIVKGNNDPYELFTIIKYCERFNINNDQLSCDDVVLQLIATGSLEYNFKLLMNMDNIPTDMVVGVILKSQNVDKIYNAMTKVKGDNRLRLLAKLKELGDRDKLLKAIFEVHGIPVMSLVKDLNLSLPERLFVIRQWFMKDNYDKLAFYGDSILDLENDHVDIDTKYMDYCDTLSDEEKTKQIETLKQISKTYKDIK